MKFKLKNENKYSQTYYSLILTIIIFVLVSLNFETLSAEPNRDQKYVMNIVNNTNIESKPQTSAISDSINFDDYILAYNQGTIDAKRDCNDFILSITGFTVSMFLNNFGSSMMIYYDYGRFPKKIPEHLHKEGYRDGYFLMIRQIHKNVARGSTSIGSIFSSTLIFLIITVFLTYDGDSG